MKSAEKHIFNQSVECLKYASLGDTCVRIVALRNLVDDLKLDCKIIPQPKPEFRRLWTFAFGGQVIHSLEELKGTEYEYGIMHSPTNLDWHYGSAAFNVFESIYWENGFFHTKTLRIRVMDFIKCDHSSNNVFLYPNESTDGNVVFNAGFWLGMCATLRRYGYKINLLGDVTHAPLRDFYRDCPADRIYPPTVDNLLECISRSCLAIGASTGPTWACLLSDIEQVVLESKRSPHGYWFFDRCKKVLEKNIRVLPTIESLMGSVSK